MSFQELYDMVTPEITAEEFMQQAEEFMQQSALEDGENDPKDVVDVLRFADRYDILETIKNHPVYGKQATREIASKKLMDDYDKARQGEVGKYPEVLKEMRVALHATKKIGIYDVGYPSRYALSCGLSKDHFAISGDGLFLFMFEIVSLEGRGLFKIVRRPHPQYTEPDNRGEGADSDAFRKIGGWDFGNIITGDQIIETLKKAYP